MSRLLLLLRDLRKTPLSRHAAMMTLARVSRIEGEDRKRVAVGPSRKEIADDRSTA